MYDIDDFSDDYVNVEEDDPAGHGTTVLDIAGTYAPEATYTTYQIFNVEWENGNKVPKANRGDLIDAMTDAADAEADVVNLSLGVPDECNGLCSLSREVEMIAEVNDVTIVAATGNKEPGERRGVDCPAILDTVIGVGGYVPYCDSEEIDKESSQWLLKNTENGGIEGPFCGQGDCANGEACGKNRCEKLWEGNVSFHNAVPDILAPVLDVYGPAADELTIQAGTSFAAPIITGLLATLLSDLQSEDIEPSADDVRNAVFASATELDSDSYCKFNANGTWGELLRQCSPNPDI